MSTTLLENKDIEMSLIINCIKVYLETLNAQEILSFAQNNPVNWKRFLTLQQQHKLGPVVFHAFRKCQMGLHFPGLMKKIIEKRKFRQRRKFELLIENNRIIREFEIAGLEVVTYKGPSFTAQFYPDQKYRDSVDIDLAIAEKDILPAARLMEKLGYELGKDESSIEDILNSRSYDIDFSWFKYEGEKIKFNAELHWQPSHRVLWVPLEFKDIMNETTKINILRHEIKTFDKIYQAVIIVLHHGLVDGWGKLRHLVDLAHLLKSLTEEDKLKLEKKLKQYRIFKTYELGKSLLAELFILKVEDKKTTREIVKLRKAMAKDIIDNKLVGKWSEHKVKLLYYLRMRDSFLDKIVSSIRFSSFYFKNRKHNN